MNKKWVTSIIVCALVLGLLPACSQLQTPVPPTAIPEPTRTPFKNVLIFDIPEMYQVTIARVRYLTLSQPAVTLPMDIYYPPDHQAGKLLPAVIYTNSLPFNARFFYGDDFPDGIMYDQGMEGWSRIIAAHGLIVVTYDTLFPNDVEAVVKHIQENGAELGIDSSRLGVFGNSAHATLASSFAYSEYREYLKFAVFYYGYIFTPDNFMRRESDATMAEYSFDFTAFPSIKQLRTDLPVLIVRCGQDWTELNMAPIDHFAELAAKEGVPLTLIRFEEAQHGFEWADTSSGELKTKGIEIIEQTLEFMQANAFSE